MTQAATNNPKDPLDGEFVYFVYCSGRIKIGFTRRFIWRMIKMATDMPFPPKLLHIEPGTPKIEKILHREFAELRVHGEWFTADQRIYDHIKRRRLILDMPEFVSLAEELK